MNYARASQRRRKRMLVLYVTFLLIWSIAVLLMPIASVQKEATKIPMFISGGGFWIGLIGTIAMAVKINNAIKRSYRFRDKRPEVKQLGLISFFKNREAKIADIAMFVSIVCFIVTRICTDNIYWLFIFLATFVFSFGMHCMLNGKNYIYLNQGVRREEES